MMHPSTCAQAGWQAPLELELSGDCFIDDSWLDAGHATLRTLSAVLMSLTLNTDEFDLTAQEFEASICAFMHVVHMCRIACGSTPATEVVLVQPRAPHVVQ